MKVTKIYWCDHCVQFVIPTLHDVTEKSDAFWGETTWEALIEKRCSLCTRLVISKVACLQCREAEPESGTDHCTGCLTKLNAVPVTNSTGAYLKFHADMEHDTDPLPEGTSVVQLVQSDLSAFRFAAFSTVEQIARACALFSTETHEVVGHISFVSGKPVVALRRELRPAGLMATLRHGSDAPLSYLAQRQAS